MPGDEFTLLGDAVWLDFVNTGAGRTDPPPDLLPDPAAWHRWVRARQLEPGPVDFGDVRLLRDHLLALARALDHERPAPAATISAVNQVLACAHGGQRLIREAGRWRVGFAPAVAPTALDLIARSAAGTLSDPAARVRQCAGRHCSLYFIDATTTGRHRWCDADICGRDATVERRRGILR